MTSLARYIAMTGLLGIAVLVLTVASAPGQALPNDLTTWLFAFALVVGECVPMRFVHHGEEGEITTSSTFALALLLTAGPAATMVVMASAAVLSDLRLRKRADRMLFNAGQYVLAVGGAALALSALSDLSPGGAPFS